MNNVIFDASHYAKFRPTYPKALFQTLYQHTQHYDRAWDCACGTGQATSPLAAQFKHVIATDIAASQIEQAPALDNVTYHVESAENTSIENNSINLVTVAQALHWFKADAFAEEVQRVLVPGGTFATWTYLLPRVDLAVDNMIDDFYENTLGHYWAQGREHIDGEYQQIPFPVPITKRSTFYAEVQVSLAGLLGYLQSWSARTNYLQQHGVCPVEENIEAFQTAWGKPETIKTMRWPILLFLGHTSA